MSDFPEYSYQDSDDQQGPDPLSAMSNMTDFSGFENVAKVYMTYYPDGTDQRQRTITVVGPEEVVAGPIPLNQSETAALCSPNPTTIVDCGAYQTFRQQMQAHSLGTRLIIDKIDDALGPAGHDPQTSNWMTRLTPDRSLLMTRPGWSVTAPLSNDDAISVFHQMSEEGATLEAGRQFYLGNLVRVSAVLPEDVVLYIQALREGWVPGPGVAASGSSVQV